MFQAQSEETCFQLTVLSLIICAGPSAHLEKNDCLKQLGACCKCGRCTKNTKTIQHIPSYCKAVNSPVAHKAQGIGTQCIIAGAQARLGCDVRLKQLRPSKLYRFLASHQHIPGAGRRSFHMRPHARMRGLIIDLSFLAILSPHIQRVDILEPHHPWYGAYVEATYRLSCYCTVRSEMRNDTHFVLESST